LVNNAYKNSLRTSNMKIIYLKCFFLLYSSYKMLTEVYIIRYSYFFEGWNFQPGTHRKVKIFIPSTCRVKCFEANIPVHVIKQWSFCHAGLEKIVGQFFIFFIYNLNQQIWWLKAYSDYYLFYV
jgi:hypothetical protein